jgi:hypothetical protein
MLHCSIIIWSHDMSFYFLRPPGFWIALGVPTGLLAAVVLAAPHPLLGSVAGATALVVGAAAALAARQRGSPAALPPAPFIGS